MIRYKGRRAALCRVAVILGTLALLGTAPALAAGVPGDLDARKGKIAPSSEQLAAVESLGAQASWNDFGTPSSLVRHGGYLGTVSGSNAAAAARGWIDANKALFRLGSVDGLKVESAHSFREGNAAVVTFRQYFGELAARPDGTLTVGLSGTPSAGWRIASASSGVTGSTGLAAQPAISAAEAWARAAANVGVGVSVVNVRGVKDAGTWKQFAVPGFLQPQQARLVVVPTPTDGIRPAWETVVVNGSSDPVLGYHSFVDAASGAVLVRNNIVENSHPPADVFNGNFQPGDAAGPAGCDTPKGPWVITAGESVESIIVTVAAVNTANDAVIVLLLNGVPVATQDLLTSPEVMNYDPTGDVAPGSYTVQICDFEDGADPLPPTNYTGSIVFNEQDTSGGNPTIPAYVARWKVFPNSPLLGTLNQDPWNIASTDIRKVWCWDGTGPAPGFTPIAGCETVAAGKPDVQNLASRVPWDVLPQQGPTFTTVGNNAFSREAWISPLTPGGAFQPFGVPPATSGVRDYSFPWTDQWQTSDCSPGAFAPPQRNDIDAAVTNLFAMHNRLHDWDYFLGFTEDTWNAQFHNFNTTAEGEEHDPLQGDAQAGGLTGGAPSYLGRDNANMVTTPDGAPPVTNMYLWQPLAGAFYAPCVDGDFDMGVIGHEYGHLTENRMIGKGGTRGGHHAGAMGESFGDFHATEYLNEYGYATVVPGQNPFALGAYATGDPIQGIRNYPGNFAPTGAFPTPGMNPAINPLQFGNMGYDLTGPQVHADGEIWTKLNYQLRQALVTKYNGSFPASNQAVQVECADGKRPANLCPGNRRWIQLYFAAMLTMPTAPSMLQARDHILAADMTLFGGANQSDLWLQFARYGFGQHASSDNSNADTDTNPAPDHMSPLHNAATVTFTSPVPNARVYVGHYEARTSPIADTNASTNNGAAGANGNNLDNVAKFVPGTYEFVANARGSGHVRFRLTLTAGQSLSFSLPFVTNWASSAPGVGATAAPGVGAWNQLGNLIDDAEGTNADYGPGAPKVDTTNPSIIVNLGGTTARSVREVKVSAMLHAGGGNRFTALRSFQILTCNNTDAICSVPTNFTLRSIAGNGGVNAFPGTTPRPTAPELILRTFVLTSAVNATHVMIRVLDNQCTGNTAFQGDQDADPANNSDCETGSPGTATPFGDLDIVLAERDDEVHIAELQVFSTTSGGGGGNGGGGNGDGGQCNGDDDVVKLGPAVASPGSTVQYTITYTNLGDIDDAECEIDDLLGDDLTYVSSTGGAAYNSATRTATWKTGKVAAGQSKSFTLTARVSDSAAVGSVLVNQAYFRLLGIDASPLGTATTLVVP